MRCLKTLIRDQNAAAVSRNVKPYLTCNTFSWCGVCSSWHGSTVLSDTKFLIHGGYNGNNALSDTFVFDTGERQHTIQKYIYIDTIYILRRSLTDPLMSGCKAFNAIL